MNNMWMNQGEWVTNDSSVTLTATTVGISANNSEQYIYYVPDIASTSQPAAPITIQTIMDGMNAFPVILSPQTLLVNPAVYDALKQYVPEWGSKEDNEGWLEKQRRNRLEKLELDIQMALLESEPIQDRRV